MKVDCVSLWHGNLPHFSEGRTYARKTIEIFIIMVESFIFIIALILVVLILYLGYGHVIGEEKKGKLEEIEKEVASCKKCFFGKSSKPVAGEGNPEAKIVVIGEAPGYYESIEGRPFVGPAGKFLNELLASIGLKREEVYIANVIKCRPPGNRDPLPAEIEACQKWLDRQIELIRPRMLVTLGRYSLARFFAGKTISRAHGTWHKKNGVIYYAMYHPAAALHQQSLRQVIIADMLKIPSLLARVDEISEEDEVPQQLSMF